MISLINHDSSEVAVYSIYVRPLALLRNGHAKSVLGLLINLSDMISLSTQHFTQPPMSSHPGVDRLYFSTSMEHL
jgi:hypothetical protein